MRYFDLHCDTVFEILRTGGSLWDGTTAVTLAQAAGFTRYVQCFALWIPDGEAAPFALYEKLLAAAHAAFAGCGLPLLGGAQARQVQEAFFTENRLRAPAGEAGKAENAESAGEAASAMLTESAEPAAAAAAALASVVENAEPAAAAGVQEVGRCALLSVEGGSLLEGELSRLDRLYADGVRTLTLTWNGENALAHGAHCPDGGLKPSGREVIGRLNALGMVCDLSHLNRCSFWEALPLCRYPAATHACFDALHPHCRNLTDRQAVGLSQKGGIIGLCFYPDFLGEGNPADRLYEQIVHGLSLGLEDALAIGSDFDGAKMHPELDRLAKLPKLYDALRQRGVKAAILQKIFYENAANFYAKVLTNA